MYTTNKWTLYRVNDATGELIELDWVEGLNHELTCFEAIEEFIVSREISLDFDECAEDEDEVLYALETDEYDVVSALGAIILKI